MDNEQKQPKDEQKQPVEVTVEVPPFMVDAARAVRRGALWFDNLARRVVDRVRGGRGGEP